MSYSVNVIDPQTTEGDGRTSYPDHLQEAVRGRLKRRLGTLAGLGNLSVLHVELPPGCASSLRVWQSHEDEMVVVLEGEATVATNDGEVHVQAGQAVGFPAGVENGHQVINRSDKRLVFIEISSVSEANVSTYPDDDLLQVPDGRGRRFVRTSGVPY